MTARGAKQAGLCPPPLTIMGCHGHPHHHKHTHARTHRHARTHKNKQEHKLMIGSRTIAGSVAAPEVKIQAHTAEMIAWVEAWCKQCTAGPQAHTSIPNA